LDYGAVPKYSTAPADRPVGTYPNCCPLGYEYIGGTCRQPQWPPVVDAGATADESAPYALKIDKTGSQSCQPGGECRFDLTIFNSGPIPHDDPVTIVDGIFGDGLQSAEIVSVTPPLPCPQQPTQIPFQCIVPTMKLDVGDKFTHTIVVRIPEGAKFLPQLRRHYEPRDRCGPHGGSAAGRCSPSRRHPIATRSRPHLARLPFSER
jgi:hypothetical protein